MNQSSRMFVAREIKLKLWCKFSDVFLPTLKKYTWQGVILKLFPYFGSICVIFCLQGKYFMCFFMIPNLNLERQEFYYFLCTNLYNICTCLLCCQLISFFSSYFGTDLQFGHFSVLDVDGVGSVFC